MMLSPISRLGSLALVLLVLSACTTSPRSPAPVENRSASARVPEPSPSPDTSTPSPASKAIPVSENAGKPGFYTVQRGDTLTRIALDHGQSWRDLAAWNNLSNAHLIKSDRFCA